MPKKKQESWQQFSFSIRIYLTCSNPFASAPHGVCVIFDLFHHAKRNSTGIAYILLVWFTKCHVVLTNMEMNIKHEKHNKRKSCLSGFFSYKPNDNFENSMKTLMPASHCMHPVIEFQLWPPAKITGKWTMFQLHIYDYVNCAKI